MFKEGIVLAGVLILFFVSTTQGQTDKTGAGRALQFDGIDDYIDLGDVYDDLQFPFTISAWVFLDGSQSSTSGIINTQNTKDILYNGFWFCVSPSRIALEYGDGFGTNNPAFRRGVSSGDHDLVAKWSHVSAVVRGIDDIDLLLNGLKMPTVISGNSNSPMVSTSPQDNAHIGNHFINGIYYRFKGLMDELRIFNRALSQTEIRAQMCKSLKGDEPGLIGYWTFDETGGDVLTDSSPKGYHGVLKGNPTRVFSGAPIGDESVYIYSTNWSGTSLQQDNVTVKNITGNPFGVHLYTVASLPSQSNGLDPQTIQPNYYGVFVASGALGNLFTVELDHDCAVFERYDNSESTWQPITDLNGISNRVELVTTGSGSGEFEMSLGGDLILCDATSAWLSVDVGDTSGKSFLWNTGASAISILVTESGDYSVTVTDGCNTKVDTIKVAFLTSPSKFSLGPDQMLCKGKTISLDYSEIGNFSRTWSDGSSQESLHVNAPGVYWLKLENVCGTSIDSVTVSVKTFPFEDIPNVITPDGNSLNDHFILDPAFEGSSLSIYNRWGKQVYETLNYKNDWDASGLASGIYFYELFNICKQKVRGTIHVLR